MKCRLTAKRRRGRDLNARISKVQWIRPFICSVFLERPMKHRAIGLRGTTLTQHSSNCKKRQPLQVGNVPLLGGSGQMAAHGVLSVVPMEECHDRMRQRELAMRFVGGRTLRSGARKIPGVPIFRDALPHAIPERVCLPDEIAFWQHHNLNFASEKIWVRSTELIRDETCHTCLKPAIYRGKQ
jgi:hypothetical protein